MNILLINPPYYTSNPSDLPRHSLEPLGLEYIAAAIIKNGRHKVDVLDISGLAKDFTPVNNIKGYYRKGLPDKYVFSALEKKQFDAIGVSAVMPYDTYGELDEFIANLKRMFPNIPLSQAV